ncbi:MAG: hypothetical protein ABEH80_01935 [Halobaculum sp.]
MPDVEITNPIVQIDLAAGETTTVPAGERWKVSVMGDPGSSVPKLNGEFIGDKNASNTTQHTRTDLFDGDTVEASGTGLVIRGYQVEA